MAKTLTIDLDEYLAFQKAREGAEAQIAELHKQLAEARLGPSDGVMRKLLAGFRAALNVTGYAMGHLSPEIARKWPKTSLLEICGAIRVMPDATPHELERIAIIESFVRDIEHWDAQRDEGYRAPPTRFVDEVVRPTMVSRSTGFLPEEPGK